MEKKIDTNGNKLITRGFILHLKSFWYGKSNYFISKNIPLPKIKASYFFILTFTVQLLYWNPYFTIFYGYCQVSLVITFSIDLNETFKIKPFRKSFKISNELFFKQSGCPFFEYCAPNNFSKKFETSKTTANSKLMTGNIIVKTLNAVTVIQEISYCLKYMRKGFFP